MKKAILGAVLLAATVTAQAQDNRWTLVGTSNHAANYVDLTRVSTHHVAGGTLKTVWWRQRQFDGYHVDAYTQFNCVHANPAFYVHQEYKYWTRTNALMEQNKMTDGRWRHPAPDTVGEAMWQIVCGR
jgi:hypothetical protein